MKVRIALIVAVCFAAIPAMAQTPAPDAPSKPAAQSPAAKPAASHLESVTSALPEKVDPVKDAAIRHLLEVTQESKLADNISGAMSMQVRSAMKRGMPDDRLQKFMVDFDQKFRDSMPSSKVMDAVVPIYAKSFSMEEIKGLIQFYETPLGQHVVQTMSQVSHDSQEAAVNMEKEAALKTLNGMATDYPELDKMLHPENAAAPAAAPGSKPVLAPGMAPAAAPAPTLKPTTPQR
jgi:uncharacterized protein